MQALMTASSTAVRSTKIWKNVRYALRYKIRRDDPDDVEGEPPRKRVLTKVMWYVSIIQRLKRMFKNKEHARLLRWHKEDRKKDGMLKYPVDGSQWRKIDRELPDFAGDARNLRFGLSTNGMNPLLSMARNLRFTSRIRVRTTPYRSWSAYS
jgi:hypothetical protein